MTDIRVWLKQILVMLFLVQVTMGIVIAMMYQPSTDAARDGFAPYGYERRTVGGTVVRTIGDTTTGRVLHDTIAAEATTVVPRDAQSTSIPLSYAQKSISGEIDSRAGVARAIHSANAHIVTVVVLLLMVLNIVRREYTHSWAGWARYVLAAALVGAAVWSGLLLPDSDYSAASRAATSNGLSEAPFGRVIVDLFGSSQYNPHIIRSYIMHILVLPLALGLLFTQDIRSLFTKPLKDLVLVISISGALIWLGIVFERLLQRPVVAAGEDIGPIWMLRPLQSIERWMGAELAGIVVVGGFLAAITLPLWYSRVGPRTMTLIWYVLALMFLAAFVM